MKKSRKPIKGKRVTKVAKISVVSHASRTSQGSRMSGCESLTPSREELSELRRKNEDMLQEMEDYVEPTVN